MHEDNVEFLTGIGNTLISKEIVAMYLAHKAAMDVLYDISPVILESRLNSLPKDTLVAMILASIITERQEFS